MIRNVEIHIPLMINAMGSWADEVSEVLGWWGVVNEGLGVIEIKRMEHIEFVCNKLSEISKLDLHNIYRIPKQSNRSIRSFPMLIYINMCRDHRGGINTIIEI